MMVDDAERECRPDSTERESETVNVESWYDDSFVALFFISLELSKDREESSARVKGTHRCVFVCFIDRLKMS